MTRPLYRLIEDVGDLLRCVPYAFEPDCKLTVVERVSDGLDPWCNVYNHMVERVTEDPAMREVHCTCCCMERCCVTAEEAEAYAIARRDAKG